MPAPGEHKTACLCVPARSLAGRSVRRQVQSRLLAYAQEIGWAYVPRDEDEARRGFDPDRARKAALFFGDLLHQLMTAQVHVHALDLPELTSFTAKGAR